MKRYINRCITKFTIISTLLVVLASCQFNPFSSNSNSTTGVPVQTKQSYPQAEIFFAVTIPTPLRNGETLYLSVVDDVTGVPYNFQNYSLNKGDDFHYYVAIPFSLGSIVKYRYVRQSSSTNLEDDFLNRPIQYRMYYVGGPGEVMDIVTSWTDSESTINYGRITGRVIDKNSNIGIPDILITAGGRQTFSDSNGEFVLEGIPEGNNNLVAYSIDGTYETFQQGAIVASGKRTPVSISLVSSKFVNVTFSVSLPANTVPSAPIRFAGNIFQIGNTFGDLQGGMSSQYSRLPVLTPLQDGKFAYSVMLPVGADIRYKYTLGDGFWNAEHYQNGEFRTRQLIVPEYDTVIQDVVETWQSDSNAPIIFDLTVPENTPVGDRISIQFNLFNWTEPIEMWSLGNNRWVYQLFGPFDYVDSLSYTYCRNDQCNLVSNPTGSNEFWSNKVTFSKNPQNFQDVITGWKWTSNYTYSENQESFSIPRSSAFWKGIEFLPIQNLSWKDYFPSALQTVNEIGSNTLILTPTWSLNGNDPVEFSLLPGHDLFGNELNSLISSIQQKEINIALFPSVNVQGTLSDWWPGFELSSDWWDNWFSHYRSFILYYTDLAAQNNVDTLILGGDWVLPSLPGGILPDGSNSNPPSDSESRWISLIAEIRQHFSGQLYWAVEYPGGLSSAPSFMDQVDGIYLMWSAPIALTTDTPVEDMKKLAANLLDNEIAPFKSTYQKPLVIALAYPSITGAGLGCSKNNQGYCKNWENLNQPNPIIDNYEINLIAQQNAYQAMFMAINERTWVDGIVSRGFYFPLALQDASASILGKPTLSLVNHWFKSLNTQ